MNEDEQLYLRSIIYNLTRSQITQTLPDFNPGYIFKLRKKIEDHYGTKNWLRIQMLALQDGSINRCDYLLKATKKQISNTSVSIVKLIEDNALNYKNNTYTALEGYVEVISHTAQKRLQSKLQKSADASGCIDCISQKYLDEFDELLRRKKSLLHFEDLKSISKIRNSFKRKSYIQILFIFSNARFTKDRNWNFREYHDELLSKILKYKLNLTPKKQFTAEIFNILKQIALEIQFDLSDQVIMKNKKFSA